MAVNIYDIKRISIFSTDIFFFDNNIWMYLFCPLSNYNKSKQQIYSNFFQNLKTNRGSIFISSMVVSEFSNRYLRIDFELWKNSTKNYSADFKKDYVGSLRYSETVNELIIQLNKIISLCSKVPDDFNSIDLNLIFKHFDKIDFNDSYLIELLSGKNIKFVTDDEDFTKYKDHSLNVVTIV